jgi:hypothetical protein
MSNGFDVEFELPPEDLKRLLKKYKKLKKYQKSSIFAVKTIDGTEDIISKLVEEAQDFED